VDKRLCKPIKTRNGNGLLFDASFVIYALKKRNLKVLEDNNFQWLTVYEVINAYVS